MCSPTIFPAVPNLAAMRSCRRPLKGTAGVSAQLYPFGKMCTLMGFESVWEFDRQHAEERDQPSNNRGDDVKHDCHP